MEVVRLLPGVGMTIRSQADRVEPAAALEERFASTFFTGHLAYAFEPIPAGTRLRQRERIRLRGLGRPLAGPIDAALRPRLLRRLAEIRDLLESAGSPGPDPES